jgi:hypothetical protein
MQSLSIASSDCLLVLERGTKQYNTDKCSVQDEVLR